MAKFKKGDRVRIAIPVPSKWSVGRMYGVGATGTVLENDINCPDILWDGGQDVWGCPDNYLELIEPQPDRMAELEDRVAELERALAVKQDPQPEPEFLEGKREHFGLVKHGYIAYNHGDGSGIRVHPGYEAVILPWPNTKGGTIIRFRERKQ